MKKILLTLAALALFGLTAHAQVPTYAMQTLVSATNVATLTTNSGYFNIDCQHQAQVAVCISFNMDGATATNVPFTFYRGLATTNQVETTASYTITLTANGTNNVTVITNLDSQGAGFLQLHTIANTNNTSVTNLTINYGVKIGSH